jgi:hypothetical protein
MLHVGPSAQMPRDFSQVAGHRFSATSQYRGLTFSDPYGLCPPCYPGMPGFAPLPKYEYSGTSAALGLVTTLTLKDLWFTLANPRIANRADNIVTEMSRATRQLALTTAVPGGVGGLTDGPGDAVRHAASSCQMAREFGQSVAEEIGNNHESGSGNTDKAHEMDRHNNEVGRGLAGREGSCLDNAVAAVHTPGVLRISP